MTSKTASLLAFLQRHWQRNPKLLAPLAVLALAILISVLLVATKPHLAPQQLAEKLVSVRVQTVTPRLLQLRVRSQGTVEPRTESELIPQVSGQVEWMSPALASGGFFNEGEELLRIDTADYVTAVDKSRAAVSRAEVEFETAAAEFTRIQSLGLKKLASASQLEAAQRSHRVAEATLLDARITLRQAELDLQRTTLRAPFTGRVRAEHVDLGQFVSRGNTIATLFATDFVEVRLPIANSQLAFLDLPLGFRGQLSERQASEVELSGEYAGRQFSWPAKLVRTEAAIDAQSRMFYAVARASTQEWDGTTPPLMVGLFVHANIAGRMEDNIVTLPRMAMRDNSQVLVVDSEDRLHFRTVELLRIEHETVLVSGGLSVGERVCVSALPVAVEGMKVKPIAEESVPAPVQQAVAPAEGMPENSESVPAGQTPGEPAPGEQAVSEQAVNAP